MSLSFFLITSCACPWRWWYHVELHKKKLCDHGWCDVFFLFLSGTHTLLILSHFLVCSFSSLFFQFLCEIETTLSPAHTLCLVLVKYLPCDALPCDDRKYFHFVGQVVISWHLLFCTCPPWQFPSCLLPISLLFGLRYPFMSSAISHMSSLNVLCSSPGVAFLFRAIWSFLSFRIYFLSSSLFICLCELLCLCVFPCASSLDILLIHYLLKSIGFLIFPTTLYMGERFCSHQVLFDRNK